MSYSTSQRNNDNNDLDESSCLFAGQSSDYLKQNINKAYVKAQPIVDKLKKPLFEIFALNDA